MVRAKELDDAGNEVIRVGDHATVSGAGNDVELGVRHPVDRRMRLRRADQGVELERDREDRSDDSAQSLHPVVVPQPGMGRACLRDLAVSRGPLVRLERAHARPLLDQRVRRRQRRRRQGGQECIIITSAGSDPSRSMSALSLLTTEWSSGVVGPGPAMRTPAPHLSGENDSRCSAVKLPSE